MGGYAVAPRILSRLPSTPRTEPSSDEQVDKIAHGAFGTTRPRVLYISYDGVAEPLGQSQVLPYLVRLAEDFDVTLISFEKPGADLRTLRTAAKRHRISLIPLNYHHRPPVISTAMDVLAGLCAVTRASRTGRVAIMHVRSYVPAVIALATRRRTGGRLLFDIRGFWVDERVEGGLWRPNGVLYRIAKRFERRFFQQADAIVTLTDASVPQVRAWTEWNDDVPIEVIPTCVRLDRFVERPERPGGPRAIWSGSVGTWYRFDLAGDVAAALSMPLVVLTPNIDLAEEVLDGYPATLRSVEPDQVPTELFARDVGLCLYRSSFSRIATAPTRLAEYLAAGMPVVVTSGLGDAETIVERHRVGAVLRGDNAHAFAGAAREIHALMSDRDLADRCRRLARERFDVERGAQQYATLYRRLIRREDDLADRDPRS
jgi:glycosyltransferase involved in cell wall biosynthesis